MDSSDSSKVLKFRLRKQNSAGIDKEVVKEIKEIYRECSLESLKKQILELKHPTTSRCCFEIVNLALKQDGKNEVAKNLLTWFIVNSEKDTLTKFLTWVAEDSKGK